VLNTKGHKLNINIYDNVKIIFLLSNSAYFHGSYIYLHDILLHCSLQASASSLYIIISMCISCTQSVCVVCMCACRNLVSPLPPPPPNYTPNTPSRPDVSPFAPYLAAWVRVGGWGAPPRTGRLSLSVKGGGAIAATFAARGGGRGEVCISP
jgi:hypothetical protein